MTETRRVRIGRYVGKGNAGAALHRVRVRRQLGDVVAPTEPVEKHYGARSAYVDRATLPLTDRQAEVYDAVPETIPELADRLAVTQNVVKAALWYLRAKALVRKVGRAWEPTP